MMRYIRSQTIAMTLVLVALPASALQGASVPLDAGALEVTVITDEAEAVLAILAKKEAGKPVVDDDWRRLFDSEGYVRLKKREAAMKRDFTDDEFRQFVLADDLAARAGTLSDTLERWRRADVEAAARLALAYLPAGTTLRAKVYPSIKPRTNSFVFELSTDPAIFLYLDPNMSQARFENTVAHELHHVGQSAACTAALSSPEFEAKPEPVRRVLRMVGSFGEGVAMLAAAGGPDIHPHAAGDDEDRARWDRDVARAGDDLSEVERFFLDVLDGKLSEEQIVETSFSFFGVQGPWYTVGWSMAVTIERAFGRARLVDSLCDPLGFLIAYNEAASSAAGHEALATWRPMLIERLKTGAGESPGKPERP